MFFRCRRPWTVRMLRWVEYLELDTAIAPKRPALSAAQNAAARETALSRLEHIHWYLLSRQAR